MSQTDVDLESDQSLSAGEAGNGPSGSDLTREFVRPANSYIWKLQSGKELALWPLCNGGDLVFQQVIDESDSNLMVVLLWVFVYVKRPIGDRAAVDAAEDFETNLLPLAWHKIKFRGAFLRWLDSLGPLTTKDKQEAVKLFDEMHGWANASGVVPAKTAGQKKTTAVSRRKSRSSSTSSRRKAGASSRRSATSYGTSRDPS